MAENNAPLAWEVEDGDGKHGVVNPATWTEVGEAILSLYGAGLVAQLIFETSEGCVGLEEWDFSDAGQLGDWLLEDVNLDDCAWHVPTEVYESEDEDAWQTAHDKGLIRTHQPWHPHAPEGYTRIVWVNL